MAAIRPLDSSRISADARPISVGFTSNECREIEFIVPQIYRLKYMLVYAYIRRNH